MDLSTLLTTTGQVVQAFIQWFGYVAAGLMDSAVFPLLAVALGLMVASIAYRWVREILPM